MTTVDIETLKDFEIDILFECIENNGEIPLTWCQGKTQQDKNLSIEWNDKCFRPQEAEIIKEIFHRSK